jgi:hypothetical protein
MLVSISYVFIYLNIRTLGSVDALVIASMAFYVQNMVSFSITQGKPGDIDQVIDEDALKVQFINLIVHLILSQKFN